MELKRIKVSELTPYENNPRNNDGAVAAVKESISQCGYVAPIIVDENMVILAGHTRQKAVIELYGNDHEVDVIVREGLSEEQKRKYRLLDNKTNEFASWDLEKLSEELESLDFGEFDFNFNLFDESYMDELLGDSLVDLKTDATEFAITFNFPKNTETQVKDLIDREGKQYIVDMILREAGTGEED